MEDCKKVVALKISPTNVVICTDIVSREEAKVSRTYGRPPNGEYDFELMIMIAIDIRG